MVNWWQDKGGIGSAGEERTMKREQALREIMEQAVVELREVLSQEGVAEGKEQWDPDLWEAEVIQFTRQLGRRMVQTWGEVKSEQAKAQAPFAPTAGADATCTGGRPYGG